MVTLVNLLPFTEPVYIFTVLITAIFLSPFLFRLIRVPDVAAFIITGVLIGPYGFNILSRDSSIELLGTVGLLYIMFIIGLELDPEKLRISRRHSVLFGIFTFAFPFLLGLTISRFLLKLEPYPSLFVAIMFSSHTLVAYPIARKQGITSDISVLTAIGGTIITDTLVLIILSMITQEIGGQPFAKQMVRIILLFTIYLLAIFYGYPRIARWFFSNVKRDRPVHFLFLILLVSISSVLAKMIGFEPIIGAFVAGLALSRSIPRNSMLMHHVDFVGNILFIPVFLIGIGMLINIRILFSNVHLWYISLVLIASALAGKWLAAYFTQRSTGMSTIQRNLLFGLSSSRAAATMAVILIGFERKMIDENLLDAAVLIILVTCLTASFLTDRYGKKLVLSGPVKSQDKRDEITMVPISNPSSMANLVALAMKFEDQFSPNPIYVLSIVHDDKSTRENLARIRTALEGNVSEFNSLSESVKVITRVDLNVSSGILRASKEYMVSDIILGWGGRTGASRKIFGSIFDQLYGGTQTLFACHLTDPLPLMDKVVLFLPANLEHERSFPSVMKKISKLPLRQGGTIEIRSAHHELPAVVKTCLPRKNKVRLIHQSLAVKEKIEFQTGNTILNVIFILRKQSVAFNAAHNSLMRKNITAAEQGNFILIVPGFE
jgi:Kef-type K+ transport system membrane component KefB